MLLPLQCRRSKFSFHIFFPELFPFVIELSAFCQPKLYFRSALFQVHFEGDKSEVFFLNTSGPVI